MKLVLPEVFAFFALLSTNGGLHAQPVDKLISEGDLFYAKLQASEALKYYLPAEKLDPGNVRLLVHISREYRHLPRPSRGLSGNGDHHPLASRFQCFARRVETSRVSRGG
jgi:hypothetical protein